MAWPHVFASLSGNVPASYLDDNFNAACLQTDFLALQTTVTGLPSNAVPQIPVAGGTAGAAATLARSDHAHPPQQATANAQTGTSYTLATTDDGKVLDIGNAAAITLNLPNSIPVGFSCLVCQSAAGQITFTAAVGSTIRQSSALTKTRTQWSIVSVYVRTNAGGAAAEYVLSGDMA